MAMHHTSAIGICFDCTKCETDQFEYDLCQTVVCVNVQPMPHTFDMENQRRPYSQSKQNNAIIESALAVVVDV